MEHIKAWFPASKKEETTEQPVVRWVDPSEHNQLLTAYAELAKRLDKIENKKWKDIFEPYKGPRFYSYNTYGDKIVVDFRSIRLDNKKEFVYKNKHGEEISNHQLELHYSDGSTENVDVIDYGNNKKLSEQVEVITITSPKLSVDWKKKPFLVFDIDGEEVEVAQHAIN